MEVVMALSSLRVRGLTGGAQIMVGTPGRVLEMVAKKALHLGGVRTLELLRCR
jgi:superfamily II DNA/RNA helicase